MTKTFVFCYQSFVKIIYTEDRNLIGLM